MNIITIITIGRRSEFKPIYQRLQTLSVRNVVIVDWKEGPSPI